MLCRTATSLAASLPAGIIDQGDGNEARTGSRGLNGTAYNAFAVIMRTSGPYSHVGYAQELRTVPGKQYRIPATSRFSDSDYDCWADASIDGEDLRNRRSGGTEPFID